MESDIVLKKRQIVGLLERICQKLELTETQYETAKSRYEAVGKWLSESLDPFLREATIYPQGSMSIGTTIRPLIAEEYDLDLVCFVLSLEHIAPAELKRLIGNRLKSNDIYARILEEKTRCWRLNYANEFHLDITPAIPNPACQNGGELVPDKELKTWKPSNPKGYQKWFKDRASLQPRLALLKSDIKAQVESLPKPTEFKGLLRRTVQLLKRHRDVYFSTRKVDSAPASAILTTLAAESYSYCVSSFAYESELDVVADVLRYLPSFIEVRTDGQKDLYFVWNPTTQGENFAEKWNTDPLLAKSFFEWQAQAVIEFESLPVIEGYDQITKSLSGKFGEVAKAAASDFTSAISKARAQGALSIAASVGIAERTGLLIKPNTFFGARQEQ